MSHPTDQSTRSFPLQLVTPASEPLDLMAGELTVTLSDENRIIGCRLRFHLSADAYYRVDNECLFHLDPEERGTSADAFEPRGSVEIEARLAGDLLADWPETITDAAGAGVYLESLGRTRPDHPALFTESWYAIAVVEELQLPEGMEGSLKSGYRTEWADEESEDEPLAPIFFTLQAFFRLEEWDYDLFEETHRLGVRYEGNNGEWAGIAIAREDVRIALFYSEYPQPIPSDAAPRIAELIARVNAGLVVGNFEMDPDQRIVRFKTSIDVEGDQLSFALVRRLVINNIGTMDMYFPAFQRVLDGSTQPKQAVAEIEEA